MRFTLSIAILPFLSLAVWGQADPAPLLLPEPNDNFIDSPKPQSGLGDIFSGINLENFVPPALPKNLKIKNTGKIEYKKEAQKIIYKGSIDAQGDNGLRLKSQGAEYSGKTKQLNLPKNVILNDPQGARIYANSATFDTEANTILLRGNVRAYQGASIFRSKEMVYDVKTQRFSSDAPAASLYPFIVDAQTVRKENGEEVFVAKDSRLTTDDVENPSFWVKADQATIYPEEKITFEGLAFEAGDRTLLKLPRYTQYFDPRLGYAFLPGVRSNLGPFLKSRYGMMLGKGGNGESETDQPWLLAQWLVDLYSLRGVGLGANFIDTRLDDNSELTGLSLYYINDFDPLNRRSSLDRSGVNDDRYRIDLAHRFDLGHYLGLETYFDANLHILSDNFFLEDFERELASTDPTPDNTLTIVGQGDHTLFTALARIRPNSFYRSDTRLPEITLEQSQHPILNLPLYYENQTLLGIYRERIPDEERDFLLSERALTTNIDRLTRIDDLLARREFKRLHTYHELSAQFNYNGWLNLTPRVGAGFTHYSGLPNDLANQSREIASFGFDTSVTWSKSMPHIQSERWGLDGLVHVFQPYGAFSHVEAGDLDEGFRGIDRFPPSTRPQQLEVGRFSAIDSLSDWSIFRVGMRNQLLTRRDEGVHQWLSVDTFVDVFNEDPEFDRSVSNLYNDIYWNPLPWMNFSFLSQFPISSSDDSFVDLSTFANFMPNDSMRIGLGHRYLDSHPILQDRNILEYSFYHRLSDEWGYSLRHQWRLEDGRLDIQQYSVHRDWGAWTGSVGISQRRNLSENEFGLIFSLTLKDIPSLTLPFSLEAQ